MDCAVTGLHPNQLAQPGNRPAEATPNLDRLDWADALHCPLAQSLRLAVQVRGGLVSGEHAAGFGVQRLECDGVFHVVLLAVEKTSHIERMCLLLRVLLLYYMPRAIVKQRNRAPINNDLFFTGLLFFVCSRALWVIQQINKPKTPLHQWR